MKFAGDLNINSKFYKCFS